MTANRATRVKWETEVSDQVAARWPLGHSHGKFEAEDLYYGRQKNWRIIKKPSKSTKGFKYFSLGDRAKLKHIEHPL
jgi:hypothetical protein